MKIIFILFILFIIGILLVSAYSPGDIDGTVNLTFDISYTPADIDSTVNLTFGEVAVGNCTYTSGTWNIDCSDNCNLAATDLGGDNIIITQTGAGQGNVTFAGNITNIGNITISGYNTSDKCVVTCSSGGCFR